MSTLNVPPTQESVPEISEQLRQMALEQHAEGKCPACGSEEIEGKTVEIEGTQAYQRVRCITCRSRWTDVYVLNRFLDLELGPNVPPIATEKEATA